MSVEPPRVRVRSREDFSDPELSALLRWLETAYGDEPGSWRREHWDDLGPGLHLVIEDQDGALLAHACIAWVEITAGTTTVRAGYLEDVATRADVRGRGLGAAVVQAAHPLIAADAEMGMLGTGSHAFYERLGWVRWRGASSVIERDGSVTPTPEEDGYLMALFLPKTPASVTADLPISRPRRDPEEAW